MEDDAAHGERPVRQDQRHGPARGLELDGLRARRAVHRHDAPLPGRGGLPRGCRGPPSRREGYTQTDGVLVLAVHDGRRLQAERGEWSSPARSGTARWDDANHQLLGRRRGHELARREGVPGRRARPPGQRPRALLRLLRRPHPRRAAAPFRGPGRAGASAPEASPRGLRRQQCGRGGGAGGAPHRATADCRPRAPFARLRVGLRRQLCHASADADTGSRNPGDGRLRPRSARPRGAGGGEAGAPSGALLDTPPAGPRANGAFGTRP
mmetsp:Transcript_114031/g.327641  ORF Transcript_114031/g.327641 Transcript_114031/m.327641 type:complete len:267 (-) Transcript_114031:34-834(-)